MSKRIPAPQALVVAAAGAAAFMFSAAAIAQETAAPVEKIEVTGSLIKRIEGETALPVSVVTKDEIEKSGATTVEQLLTVLPITTSAGATTTSQNAGATVGGLAAVSLHGLTSVRTLVLINGRRVAPYGIVTDATSVDVNSLPLSAVQRVEILKEGASAIYGSDAIGGVVNFILRQDYQGAEISANYGETKEGGGGTKGVNLIYGYGDLHKDRFNVMVSGGYSKEDPLWGGQRDFASRAIAGKDALYGTAYDSTSRNTFPANITIPGAGGRKNISFPLCSPSTFDPNFASSSARFGQCRFDPGAYVPLIDKAEHENVFASFKYQINESMLAYLEGSINKNIINNREQPSPVSAQFALPPNNPLNNPARPDYAIYQNCTQNAAAPCSNVQLAPTSPYYPFTYVTNVLVSRGLPVPATNAAFPTLIVNYRTFFNGMRDLTDSTFSPRITLGLKGTMFDWDYDVNFLHSANEVTEHNNDGYFIQSKLLPMLNSGTINILYPALNPPPTDAQIAAMRATNFVRDAYQNKTYLDSVTAKVSGDVFPLPGGSAGVALGAEFRREKFEESTDPYLQTGDVSGYGGNILPVGKQRNVYSGFGEVDLPVLKGLEVDFAARFDHYENTGSRTSPKVGIRFQPVQQVLLRGSYSYGFRAPSLTDLYAPDVQSVTTTLTDPADCNAAGVGAGCSAQFTSILGGNSRLKPETSRNLSLGIVLQPTKNLSAAIDYFDIKVKDVIVVGLNPNQILSFPSLSSLITRSTTPDPTLPGAFPISLIDDTTLNLGAQRNQGFDVDVNWGVPIGEWGKVTMGLNATYYQRVVLQNPDGSWSDQIDTANQTISGSGGMIPRWKHRASVDWARGDWDLLLIQNYQGSYQDLFSNADGSFVRNVDPYYTYDANLTYTGFKDWRIGLGVKNLANQDPPYTGAGGNLYFQEGFDPSYADPRGRFIYGMVTYRIK